MTTWYGDDDPPQPPPITLAGWIHVAVRGAALSVVIVSGLIVLLVLRMFEAPFFGPRRPLTPHINVLVCRITLVILGLQRTTVGRPDPMAMAMVANHASWLDIFVLNALSDVYFVSKAEVAGWPGIGWLARATGTVFIARDRARAAEQAQVFRARLAAGHRLLFFPEGTSSDGLRVLPFKSTLFAAFFGEDLRHVMQVQPVSVRYSAPEGQDPRFYGWWGDMDFAPHLLAVLAAPGAGRVKVTFHPSLPVRDFANRKSIALAAEAAVRSAGPAL